MIDMEENTKESLYIGILGIVYTGMTYLVYTGVSSGWGIFTGLLSIIVVWISGNLLKDTP